MSEALDLINRLLAEAGMVLEDVTDAALIATGQPIARIVAVIEAAEAATTLASAARIISRRYADQLSTQNAASESPD